MKKKKIGRAILRLNFETPPGSSQRACFSLKNGVFLRALFLGIFDDLFGEKPVLFDIFFQKMVKKGTPAD